MCPPGDTRRTIIADLLRGRHPAVVSLGLASQPELDALDRAVRSHLDDPRILVVPHLSFLTWGRKPAGGKGALTAPIGSRRPSP